MNAKIHSSISAQFLHENKPKSWCRSYIGDLIRLFGSDALFFGGGQMFSFVGFSSQNSVIILGGGGV